MAPEPLYTLWPRQMEAMRLLGLWPEDLPPRPVEELLYGGEAGGGKSHVLRAVGVTLCTNWPGAVVPLFRRTYPELEETHIRAIQAEVPAPVARYHADRRELHFTNGSILEFRHCERENDVHRYLSAEWEGLLVDEATTFTAYQVSVLRSRVRSTRQNWRPVIVYGSTPGNVGHVYFRDGFVDAAPAGRVFLAPPDDGALLRCFLRARLDDNPSLGADYKRMLEGIRDPDLRRALAEGDWHIFAGQFFREWRAESHTCEPFEVPPHWTQRRISVDFGYGAPWCALFLVRDENAWQQHRIPRWYCYREFYEAEVQDQEQARRIMEAVDYDLRLWSVQVEELMEDGKPLPPAGPRYTAVGDPSMWNRQPSGTSIADAYRREGVLLEKANNDRTPGWQRLHAYLAAQADGRPALVFFDTCTASIRTIPALVHDNHDPEDVDTTGEDHAADAARYFVMQADPLTVRRPGPPRRAGHLGTAAEVAAQREGEWERRLAWRREQREQPDDEPGAFGPAPPRKAGRISYGTR